MNNPPIVNVVIPSRNEEKNGVKAAVRFLTGNLSIPILENVAYAQQKIVSFNDIIKSYNFQRN
ncbi:MAG: hypothetical protein ACXADY_01880 [Candidatus Hodarchaeales archaeon]